MDESVWQVVKTRARFPNRRTPDGREDNWANIGKNATWQAKQPVVDPGTQIVVNATASIPKTTTTFPDYFMYGAGGACAAQGYDPPGGWLCASYGGMHGGTWTEGSGWSGGYPTPFPASLSMSNTTGQKQTVFPNSVEWDVHGGGGADGNGTKALLRSWVNGWFTSMWELEGWDEAASKLTLGRGGFHGGQPVYLDFNNPDGSPSDREAFGFENNTLNASNRINPGDMSQVRLTARKRLLSAASQRRGSSGSDLCREPARRIGLRGPPHCTSDSSFLPVPHRQQADVYEDLNRRVCLASCAGGVLCGRSAE